MWFQRETAENSQTCAHHRRKGYSGNIWSCVSKHVCVQKDEKIQKKDHKLVTVARDQVHTEDEIKDRRTM